MTRPTRIAAHPPKNVSTANAVTKGTDSVVSAQINARANGVVMIASETSTNANTRAARSPLPLSPDASVRLRNGDGNVCRLNDGPAGAGQQPGRADRDASGKK